MAILADFTLAQLGIINPVLTSDWRCTPSRTETGPRLRPDSGKPETAGAGSFPIDLAVDLMDAADRPLRLAQGTQVYRHRAGGRLPPCLADLPGQLLLAEQRGLGLRLDAGLDELGEFLQSRQPSKSGTTSLDIF